MSEGQVNKRVDIGFWYYTTFFFVSVGVLTDGLKGFLVTLGIMEIYLVSAIVLTYFDNNYNIKEG